MNYLKQLNTFFELLLSNPLSANAQCLYLNLLNINNKCNWLEEFTTANSTLMGFTNLNKQALYRARNELIQRGLIKFKKGINQNQSGKYKIIEFVTADNTPNNTAGDTANDTADDMADDTNNKLNKTKLKKENIKKKYGEYKNVKFTDNEFEKVKEYFPKDYMQRIQDLDDYIQRTGKKYKDFFATLKTWARKDGYKPPEKEEKPKENFVAVDTSDLTPEEYGKLVKGEITTEELIKKGRIHV